MEKEIEGLWTLTYILNIFEKAFKEYTLGKLQPEQENSEEIRINSRY